MKSCCKTGDQPPTSKLNKWASRVIWAIVLLTILGLSVIQMFNL
jgi:hypothetical protein